MRYTWDLPLRNGPGFFLGVEVPPGFYDRPEASWLRRYHAVLLGEHVLEACVLAILLALAQWQAIPIWAGGGAVLYTGTMMTFVAWTRHSLGASPPVRAVALALESRRLGDYISWPLEALAAAVVAFSWWLLVRHGDTRIDWLSPLQSTWIALGKLDGSEVGALRKAPRRSRQRRGLDVRSAELFHEAVSGAPPRPPPVLGVPPTERIRFLKRAFGRIVARKTTAAICTLPMHRRR